MFYIIILLVTQLSFFASANFSLLNNVGDEVEAHLNFTEMANRHGYKSIEHTVVTDDGYILRVFQIPGGRHCKGPLHKTPLIMVHGLMDSSDTFLVSGPDKGLGYILPDNCYNTFYLNNRGNKYSRRHTSLNPDKDAEFWDFTFDELGMYDLAAVIDFVLQSTGSDQVFHVGHSQGTTQFFVLMSSKPAYNHKIKLSIALAPVAYMHNMFSPAFRLVATFSTELQIVGKVLGVNEVFTNHDVLVETMKFICYYSQYKVCRPDLYIDSGQNKSEISYRTKIITLGHFPCGTSRENFVHFGQGINVDKFRRYDRGVVGNLRYYGKIAPPEYDLTQITAPVVLLCGKHDWIVSLKDAAKLRDQLSNVVQYHVLKPVDWSHFDFAWGDRVPVVIAPIVLGHLKAFSGPK